MFHADSTDLSRQKLIFLYFYNHFIPIPIVSGKNLKPETTKNLKQKYYVT